MGRKSRHLKIHAVDLFCGIGGLTHGLSNSGISVKLGVDIDVSCKYVYEENNKGSKFVNADIRDIQFEDIASYYEDADIKVLVGCTPCQPFSAHTRKNHFASKNKDCSLVLEFARIVEEGKPDIVSMENVPGLAKHNAFHKFVSKLKYWGYECCYNVVSCSQYGVPQTRRRLVLLASKLGKINLCAPTKRVPVIADFIKGLPEISDGQTSCDDSIHVSLRLSEKNLERIKQSRPGGSWKDWESKIVSKCHRKAYYPAPYGRMRWDAPAPTITTQFCYYSTGRFGHPEQNRAISVREAALLQTFPSGYKFAKPGAPIVVRDLARHVGNAVPVKLAENIGRSINLSISGECHVR